MSRRASLQHHCFESSPAHAAFGYNVRSSEIPKSVWNTVCLKEKLVFGNITVSYLDVGRYPINYARGRRLQSHPVCFVAGLFTYLNTTLSVYVLGKTACFGRLFGCGGDLMKGICLTILVLRT